MNDVRMLLHLLTSILPPDEGKRHAITLDEKGILTLTLSRAGEWMEFRLGDEDLAKSPDDLLAEVVKTIQQVHDARQARPEAPTA